MQGYNNMKVEFQVGPLVYPWEAYSRGGGGSGAAALLPSKIYFNNRKTLFFWGLSKICAIDMFFSTKFYGGKKKKKKHEHEFVAKGSHEIFLRPSIKALPPKA